MFVPIVRRRAAIASILVGISGLAVSATALAVDPTVAGHADIGTVPGTTTHAGFWKDGQTASFQYALKTDGVDTFVNAPTSTGSIHFRRANAGAVSGGVPDLLTIESNGEVDITSTGAYAILAQATTATANATGIQGSGPFVGVGGFDSSGTHTGVSGASSDGVGVYGFTSHTTGPGIGVKGVSSGDGTGVRGESNTGNGVLGITSSMTNAAISALAPNNSSLAYWGTGNINITGDTAGKQNGGMWLATSDARVKKDVREYRQGLEEILRVRPVTYKFNGLGGTDDNGKEYVGVIAQELEKIVPSMVRTKRAKLRQDDAEETDIRQVDPSAFTYILINAVKEQQKAISEQQKLIERQEARLASLERGRSPLMSSIGQRGTWGALTLGLVPLGLVAAIRKGKKKPKTTTPSP
jgi:hypothetical protein